MHSPRAANLAAADNLAHDRDATRIPRPLSSTAKSVSALEEDIFLSGSSER